MKIVAEATDLSINQDAALGEPLADLGVAESVSYIPAHGRSGSFSRRSALSDGDAVPPSTLGIDEDVRSRALDSLVHLDGYPCCHSVCSQPR